LADIASLDIQDEGFTRAAVIALDAEAEHDVNNISYEFWQNHGMKVFGPLPQIGESLAMNKGDCPC
jgi:hypothetical protein